MLSQYKRHNIFLKYNMLTKQDIFTFLEENGIKHDDKIAVHAALRSVGPIENGADGLIDAMSSYLDKGLLIIPTHTWDEVCREHPFYDVRTSVPCIGTLAKVAAFRKDGVRSLHPTHSVTAFGPGAADFVKGEELCGSPAPLNSSLSKLYEEHGKILLIGVGLERNTYLHSVDERLDIPDRLNQNPFVITIKDYDGNLIQSPPFHTHYTANSDQCVSEYYPNYKEAFDYTGAVKYGKLGNALVYICDARAMTDTVRLLWKNTDHDLCIKKETIPKEYYS